MEGNYPITLNGKTVGQVQVCRKGLYYLFVCRCEYDEDSVCRLMIRCQGTSEKLGIMVPDKGEFVLKKQIPVKHFGNEEPEFYIFSENENQKDGIFVPISSDEPFEYLSKVKDAHLEEREGVIGAWIPEEKTNAGE